MLMEKWELQPSSRVIFAKKQRTGFNVNTWRFTVALLLEIYTSAKSAPTTMATLSSSPPPHPDRRKATAPSSTGPVHILPPS